MRRSPTPPPEPPQSPSSAPAAGADAFRKLDAVSGILTEFVCPANGGTGFKFAIDTPEGKKLFSFKDPESVSIIGKPGGKADVYCGRQEAKPRVKAEYLKTEEPGVDGAQGSDLRTLKWPKLTAEAISLAVNGENEARI